MQLSGHQLGAPNSAVVRLQNALNVLGQVKRDPKLFVQIDGVVGPRTAEATNRALGVYVVQGVGPIPAHWQRASTSIITGNANGIAEYIEHAAGISGPPPSAPPPAAAPMPPSGGSSMPFYPQQQTYAQPAYYPQPNYGPPRAPGGLPGNQATLDVRAFIPAQYDHIQLDPMAGFAIVAVGLVAVYLVMHHKAAK